MKNIKRQLLKIMRPLAGRAAEDLADLLVTKLQGHIDQIAQSFDLAVSAFASELEMPDATATKPTKSPKSWPTAAVGQVTRAKTKSTGGKRRNHCGKCGAEGFQTKTCGRTHNVDGKGGMPVKETHARAHREPRARKSVARSEDDDEVEAAVVARPLPVVANQPAAPKDPPRSAPFLSRSMMIADRQTMHDLDAGRGAVSMSISPKPVVQPKKVVDRDKAIREIRAEKLRRAAVARADLKQDKDEPVEPVASIADEESEWEATGLSEDDSVKLSSAQIALD